MSRKLISLITCLVLVFNFGFVSDTAQADDNEEYVIYPAFIYPPDGSVDIYVPVGDTIIIKTGWGACTRGLAQAWTMQDEISLSVNGESVFSTPDEAQSYWGKVESYPINFECINGTDFGYRVYWIYSLGELEAGTYTIHYEENVDHPFLDGGDFNGDGEPDINERHYSIDFNIIVTKVGSITGIVTAEETGDAIEGMVVDVCEYEAGWDGPCFSDWTDADGTYFIPGIPVGTYRVFSGWDDSNWVVEYYDEQSVWQQATPIDVEANTELSEIDFTLVLGGSISGTVTEQGTGAPLASAWVEACDYDNGWPFCFYGETDVDGSYFIPSVPAGSYRVTAYLEGNWVPEIYSEQVDYGLADPVTVMVDKNTPDIDFTLELGGRISGHVSDANGNVAGIHVDVCTWDDSYCAGNETDENGSYTVYGIPSGDYLVSVWGGQGFWLDQLYDHVGTREEATLVTVTAGKDTDEINFDLLAAGTVSGHVSDSNGDVAGVHVDVCTWDDSYCTGNEADENGNYVVYGLPPRDDYLVSIWGGQGFWLDQLYDHVGTREEATWVTVIAGQDTGEINFDLETGGTISGMVTEQETGLAVVDMEVAACPYDFDTGEYMEGMPCYSGWTDTDGSYFIWSVPAGTYIVDSGWWGNWVPEIYSEQVDYGLADSVVVIAGENTTDIDFTLELGGSISGMVTEQETGLAVGDMEVAACPYDFENGEYLEGMPCYSGWTEVDGSYFIRGVPAGTYIVDSGWSGNWVPEIYFGQVDYGLADPVVVGADENTPDINFTLEMGGSISGNVSDANGPAAYVWVDACTWDDIFCQGTETDENGDYTIYSLIGGDYRVSVWGGQGGWLDEFYDNQHLHEFADPVPVTVGSDTGGIDFFMDLAGSISGSVLDIDGFPIGDNIDVSACFEDDSFCGWTSVQDDDTYVITGLPAGDYRVHAYQYPEGYWIDEVYEETRDWDAYTPVTVTGSTDIPNINFTLELGGAITGVVTDGEGNPLEGIWVSASKPDFFSWAMTDANGEYWIFALPSGDYDVFVSQQGDWIEQHYMTPVSVIGGQDIYNINFALEPGGSISGTVTDEFGNHIPERIDVAACWITAPDVCFWTTVLADSTYTIIGLPAGEFYVHTYEVPQDGTPSGWIGYIYPTTIIFGTDQDVTDINFMLMHE